MHFKLISSQEIIWTKFIDPSLEDFENRNLKTICHGPDYQKYFIVKKDNQRPPFWPKAVDDRWSLFKDYSFYY